MLPRTTLSISWWTRGIANLNQCREAFVCECRLGRFLIIESEDHSDTLTTYVFLYCSKNEVRARREMIRRSEKKFPQALEDVLERDRGDLGRYQKLYPEVSPLQFPELYPDTHSRLELLASRFHVLIDTAHCDVERTFSMIVRSVRERGGVLDIPSERVPRWSTRFAPLHASATVAA